jgi:hypothetical protein
METRAPRLCLLGAAPDSGNLGVNALFTASLLGLMSRMPAAHLTVFDFGKGVRKCSIDIEGRTVTFDRCGMHNSRRYYARDCLWNIRVSSWLGGLNNPAAIALRGAEAVLDISGGDSFCDLYGRKRFEGVTVPKEICLRLETPLILLRQLDFCRS